MKNSLLVIDIDGTFAFDSAEVAAADLAAFKKVENKCLTAIATGRSLAEINYLEKKNQLHFAYKIGFNGALIVNDAEKVIYDQPLAAITLNRLADYLVNNQITFDALDGHNRFGNFQHKDKSQLLGINYIYEADPYSKLKNRKIYKLNLRPDNQVNANKLTLELTNLFPELSIFQVGAKRIEISAQHTSKGAAIRKIADKKMIVIAVGDSENDVSMFQEATISYCMSHAPLHVKLAASYVVPRFSDAVFHFTQSKEVNALVRKNQISKNESISQ